MKKVLIAVTVTLLGLTGYSIVTSDGLPEQ